jgi:YVTN family beta-propeller protein
VATANVYAHAGIGMFSASVARFPPRVYVPDELNGTVTVIDPRTFKILFRYSVGLSPEHVTPDWDLQRLYVEASFSNRLTVIDPLTGRPTGHHTVPGPYNLYFTPNGKYAIVVRDAARTYGGQEQLYFYDRLTWRLVRAVRIPWAGADHLDFSADGSYFLISTEYSGWVAKVSVAKMAVVGAVNVGGLPVDVRLAPDGQVFYVANQGTNGVSIVDPVTMHVIGFIKTGIGAHGLGISRDARRLYVTNREAGTLSVIDLATNRVSATWHIGGTPDMIAVSPDGSQLWISNRYSGSVSVVSARTGRVIALIHVGGHPHGLCYFPEPGRYSLGHNGIYR